MRIPGNLRRLALLGSSGGIIISAVASAGLAVTTVSASASATTLVSHTFSAAQQKAELSYWTPARMAAAKNVSMMTIKGSPKSTSTSARAATGAPGAVAGHAPSGASSSGVNASPQVPTDGYTYPFPFTRFQVSPTGQWKKYPYETNGKVFFTNDGTNYVCSGTSVTVPDGREVWTAGHCVANTDGTGLFDSSFLFVPAYNGNVSNFDPKGEWVSAELVTTSGWLSSSDFSLDEGASETVNHGTGGTVTLSSKVGNAGFEWNFSWIEDFSAFGYPQASPFNGNNLIQCDAGSAVQDTGIGGGGSPPIGIGCDMTGGSSGGAWETSWGGGGTGWIDGHNDYKYSSQPLAMYSPYQDTTSNNIRCFFDGSGSGDGC